MNFYALIFAISLGIGLAAACGFRIFMPPFFLGIAMRSDWVQVSSEGSFGFLQTDIGLIVLGIASIAEIAAYYVPWLDNLLDTIASPAAIIAGVLVTGAALDGSDPIVQWALAIIAGGGVAGSVQVGTVATRALSTMTTGGLGNPIVSTVEAGACITCALLAVFLPLIALIISILMVVYAIKFFKTRQSKKSNELPV